VISKDVLHLALYHLTRENAVDEAWHTEVSGKITIKNRQKNFLNVGAMGLK
jgi:hypothetical protein